MAIISLKAIVIVGSLIAPEPGSYDAAMQYAAGCETATSWAEQVAPGMWRGVCGDDNGHELVNATAEEVAELHYAMAESAGANADAAYEDAIARENELDARGELPCYVETGK